MSHGGEEPVDIHLRRALGLGDVVLYFVTACTSLQWVAFAAAAGPRSLLVWAFAAVAMFLPVSVCTVALAARYPEEGGMYVWSKLAFGPFVGFLTGWTYWASNLPYFAGMLYFAAGSALWIGGGEPYAKVASPAWFIGFAVGGLALATVLNVRGLAVCKWLNNAAAIARCITLLLLIAIGVIAYLRYGSATPLTAHALRPRWQLNDLLFWATIAFAMTGPESASFMGGEIRDPRHTVPRALLRAAPIIVAIYMVGTLAVLVAVPSGETSAMYGVVQAAGRLGQRLGWEWLAPATGSLVVLTCLGSASAWLGSVARIPFVAGLDHFLPSGFSRLHPRYGSPTTALLVQAAIACLFAIMGQAGTTVKGAYEVLVNLMVIGLMVPYLFLFSATVTLARDGSRDIGLQIPGGRVSILAAAVVGLSTTVGAIVLSLVPPPDEPTKAFASVKIIGMTLLMLGTGVVFYWTGTRRAGQTKGRELTMNSGRP
jgi:glutamate:GABA antiporter